MSDTVDKDKFDAVLSRLIAARPQTEAETKAKAEADRRAKKAKLSE
jgi:hypothetical protein